MWSLIPNPRERPADDMMMIYASLYCPHALISASSSRRHPVVVASGA